MVKLFYISGFSSYRTVNTLNLGCRNQSDGAVSRNNSFWFWEPYKLHEYIVWTEHRIFSFLNPVAMRITAGL